MSPSIIVFSRDDLDFIVAFAGCTLDDSPGSNWVQEAGGLPEYICQIARAVKRTGKTTSQAIAIAVSRCKKWASGVGVDKDTQAKAAKAIAEWEKLKTKSKAKKTAKKSERVAATHDSDDVLCLAAVEYNVDNVRTAFNARTREARKAWRAANPTAAYDDPACPSSLWVREMWNTFLIVQSDYGDNPDLYKVPYSVDDKGEVSFGDAVEVKTEYVAVAEDDMAGSDLTDEALQKLMDLTGPCPRNPLDKFLALTPAPSSLSRVIALTVVNRE